MNASELFVALGMHNVSGFQNLDSQEIKKYTIRNVKETVKHPKYDPATYVFDFSLFILENPVAISKKVSPVCLPRPNEFNIFEGKKNILIGFGVSKLWYQLYDDLLGGKLESVLLIPLDILFNETAIIQYLQQPLNQENIISDFFKTFISIFPGIGACIDNENDGDVDFNYKFVCNITGVMIDKIIDNIAEKISNTGRDLDQEDVNYFLG